MHWATLERWLVVVALMLAFPCAASAASWSSPQVLGPGTAWGGFISVASDQADEVLIGYTDGRAVYVRERSPSGDFGSAQTIAQASSDDQFHSVDIAMDPDGNAVIAWHVKTPPNQSAQLEAATRAPGGSFGPPQIVTTSMRPGDAPQPVFDLKVARGGWAALVWERYEQDHGPSKVVDASIRPPGGEFGTPEPVSPDEPWVDYPRIAIDAQGIALATWTNRDEVAESATRQPGGPWGPIEGGTPVCCSVAALDFDQQGNALAVSSIPGPGDPLTTVQARFRPAGAAFGPLEDVSQPRDRSAYAARALGFDGSGTATVLWQDGNTHQLFASQRAADRGFDAGSMVSEVRADLAKLHVRPDGAAVALWLQWVGGDMSDLPKRLFLARRAAGAGAFGSQVEVPTVGYGALDADAAVDARGNVVLVWSASYGYKCSAIVASEYSDAVPSMEEPVQPPACAGPPPAPGSVYGDLLPPHIDFWGVQGAHPVARRVPIALRCSEDCTAVLKGTLVRGHMKLGLKAVRRKLLKARRTRVTLRLPRNAARRLGGQPRKLVVKVSVTDRAHNRTTSRRTIRLAP